MAEATEIDLEHPEVIEDLIVRVAEAEQTIQSLLNLQAAVNALNTKVTAQATALAELRAR